VFVAEGEDMKRWMLDIGNGTTGDPWDRQEMILASDHEAEVERLREALQRCADYLDTSATCNSDRAMASMARAALKENET
jgi:hypothetical protein